MNKARGVEIQFYQFVRHENIMVEQVNIPG